MAVQVGHLTGVFEKSGQFQGLKRAFAGGRFRQGLSKNRYAPNRCCTPLLCVSLYRICNRATEPQDEMSADTVALCYEHRTYFS